MDNDIQNNFIICSGEINRFSGTYKMHDEERNILILILYNTQIFEVCHSCWLFLSVNTQHSFVEIVQTDLKHGVSVNIVRVYTTEFSVLNIYNN